MSTIKETIQEFDKKCGSSYAVGGFLTTDLGDKFRLDQLLMNDWLRTVQEYVEGLLLSGASVPGWKVVEKIGRAKWVSDEEKIAGTLSLFYDIPEDLVRPRRLTTIGDVTKLLKAAGATKPEIDTFLMDNTIKESSGLTVAPESDRRPAVNAAERAFGDVNLSGAGA